MLTSFTWAGMMRLEAAMILFGRVIDPHRLDLLQEPMSAEERAGFNSRLGILAMFSPLNPTGRYVLNLSRQVAWRRDQRAGNGERERRERGGVGRTTIPIPVRSDLDPAKYQTALTLSRSGRGVDLIPNRQSLIANR